MNALESQKRLLLAESELNREQLAEDWAVIAAGVRARTERAKSFGSMASAAAVLAAGLAAFKRGQSVDAHPKPSRWETLLKAVGLASTLWATWRARGHGQAIKERQPRATPTSECHR